MELEGEDEIHVTKVANDVIPKVGQEFQSIEDAKIFYNHYARQVGFSIRMANSRRDQETGELNWKVFVCSKEGKTNETWDKIKNLVARSGERKRGCTRCGCKAKMAIVKSRGRKVWAVSQFIEGHNHVLTTPRKVHLLWSHRDVSTAKKSLTKTFSEANIRICQQVRCFEIEAGGPAEMGFTDRDIRNHKRDVRNKKRGHDAQTLIQSFETEKHRNDNFYYAFETDENNILKRIFWADCECRSAYAYFGDAIVFDTTHGTNKYGMFFAPLAGVNHHGQTTIFACGLLSDQKADSFVWLFSEFLKAMPMGRPPLVIVTDQDAAINLAVSKVFPQTKHRLCLWHITNKFSEKINATLYKEEYTRLKNVVYNSESPQEFERGWMELMKDSELGNNRWLQEMYEIRHRWVPGYVRQVFSAGMASSQRVESNHAFFKRYVNDGCSLNEFMTRFNRALMHQRHEELVSNHLDIDQVPKMMITGNVMEQQMAKIYTKSIFLLFQQELQKSMSYICTMDSISDTITVYTIKRYVVGDNESRERKLTHHASSDALECSCRLFDYEGYPCRHMLRLMFVQQVMVLPDKYILRRWTKDAKSMPVYESTPGTIEGGSFISRRGSLVRLSLEVVDEYALTEARTCFLSAELKNLRLNAKNIDDGGTSIQLVQRAHDTHGWNNLQSIQDPVPVYGKGRGKRLRTSKEIAMSQGNRNCSVCNSSGHNRRTCPNIQSRSDSVYEPYRPEFSNDPNQDDHYNIMGNVDYDQI